MILTGMRSMKGREESDMQNRLHRICPCCGKHLTLVPPSKSLLPNRVGVSSNFVEYYFPSNKRYFNITSNPHSHYKQTVANKLTYRGNLNKNFILFDKSGWNIVPINNTMNKIKKGGLWIFSHEMVLFCKNCNQKLSINRNPLALFSSAVKVIFIVTAVIGSLISLGVMTLTVFAFVGIVWLLILFEAMVELFFTAKYLSNFVPTDEFDSLIYPERHLSLFIIKNSNYLREGNVFMTELDESSFYIYLVYKTKKAEFHICGIDGEQECLLNLIHKKQERGEKVVLPLMFEGKFVGNAEVLETYDPPQSSNEER